LTRATRERRQSRGSIRMTDDGFAEYSSARKPDDREHKEVVGGTEAHARARASQSNTLRELHSGRNGGDDVDGVGVKLDTIRGAARYADAKEHGEDDAGNQRRHEANDGVRHCDDLIASTRSGSLPPPLERIPNNSPFLFARIAPPLRACPSAEIARELALSSLSSSSLPLPLPSPPPPYRRCGDVFGIASIVIVEPRATDTATKRLAHPRLTSHGMR